MDQQEQKVVVEDTSNKMRIEISMMTKRMRMRI